jgi:hypothetical protein
MKRLVSNMLLLMISTLISLVAAEFGIRLISPQGLSGSWKQESKSGGYWVNRDGGESMQQFEGRVVRYHFGKYHLRIGSTPSEAPHKILVLGDSAATYSIAGRSLEALRERISVL